jgi:hypothetical protein
MDVLLREDFGHHVRERRFANSPLSIENYVLSTLIDGSDGVENLIKPPRE